jgi:hypothetical protein
MARSKSKVVHMVADGAGGMMKVEDHRFEQNWPIRFEVPTDQEQADHWLQYLNAECFRRGWNCPGIGQLERAENSGSLTINAGTTLQLAAIWERKRMGGLTVRARPGTGLSLPEAREFLDRVTDQCRARATEQLFCRGTLEYIGRPWRGELWLDGSLRIAPPSRDDQPSLVNGARKIHIDGLLQCIGPPDRPRVLHQTLQEVSAFLSVVTGHAVEIERHGRAWTYMTGASDCEVRNLGYFETQNPTTMPARGTIPPTTLRRADDPDHGLFNEQFVRDDVVELWQRYRALPANKRQQFLQAATKWQEAMMHWSERDTLSFALMVIACEVLKPTDRQFWDHNAYHVIEGLLGKAKADEVRQHPVAAQLVRNTHIHTGELLGSEFVRMVFMSSYRDPSFDEAHRAFAGLTPEVIIEWLRQGGTFTMPTRQRRKTWRRFARDHVLTIIPIAVVTGLGVCLILGTLLGH